MNIRIEVHQSDLERMGSRVALRCMEAKLPVHEAMAKRFYDITIGNFGTAGVDRPLDWNRLTPPYSKRVRREIATLVVSGALRDAIQHDASPHSGKVHISDGDIPYATVHQYGGGNNIPARPYFPIDADGNMMPYTESEVLAAGQRALQEALI